MVVGDVVNAIGGANAILDFQPAAGIEVAIKMCFCRSGVAGWALFDGVNISDFLITDEATAAGIKNNFTTMLIDNTNYLRITASGGAIRNGFSGIEIG